MSDEQAKTLNKDTVVTQIEIHEVANIEDKNQQLENDPEQSEESVFATNRENKLPHCDLLERKNKIEKLR
jgi:hypothetical protein